MRWYPRFSVDFSTSRHDLCQSSRSATYSIVYQNHLHDITPVNMLGAVWRSVFALMSAATAPLVVGALLHISIRSTHMLDRHSRPLVRHSCSRCSFVCLIAALTFGVGADATHMLRAVVRAASTLVHTLPRPHAHHGEGFKSSFPAPSSSHSHRGRRRGCPPTRNG